MTERDFSSDFSSDEVPVADAAEQSRQVAENAELETVDPGERIPVGEPDMPLETDESDWQDQRLIVDLDPDDDFR